LVGEPILALAAIDEQTAETAISKISVTFERPAFRPRSPRQPHRRRTRRLQRRQYLRLPSGLRNRKNGAPIRWRASAPGNEPTAEPQQTFSYGDLDAALADSAFVYESGFTTAGYPHQSMEPRSAMAYWENGKLYLHGTSQSLSALADGMASIVGVPQEDFVFINEATGGGFGQRARANSIPSMAIPAKMSQKINRPCNDARDTRRRNSHRRCTPRLPRLDQVWLQGRRHDGRC
jgi:CO/xanthine dehydrogenase Mo-binding subunit